jgi:hypothetical protein
MPETPFLPIRRGTPVTTNYCGAWSSALRIRRAFDPCPAHATRHVRTVTTAVAHERVRARIAPPSAHTPQAHVRQRSHQPRPTPRDGQQAPRPFQHDDYRARLRAAARTDHPERAVRSVPAPSHRSSDRPKAASVRHGGRRSFLQSLQLWRSSGHGSWAWWQLGPDRSAARTPPLTSCGSQPSRPSSPPQRDEADRAVGEGVGQGRPGRDDQPVGCCPSQAHRRRVRRNQAFTTSSSCSSRHTVGVASKSRKGATAGDVSCGPSRPARDRNDLRATTVRRGRASGGRLSPRRCRG